MHSYSRIDVANGELVGNRIERNDSMVESLVSRPRAGLSTWSVGVAWLVAGDIGGKASVFIALMLAANWMTKPEYGVFRFALGVVTYWLAVIDTFSLLATREVAHARGRAADGVHEDLLGLRLVLSVVLFAFHIAFCLILYHSQLSLLMVLLVAGIRLILRGGFLVWLFQGFENMRTASCGLLMQGLMFLGFLLVFHSGLTAELAIVLMICSEAAATGLLAYFFWQQHGRLRLRLPFGNGSRWDLSKWSFIVAESVHASWLPVAFLSLEMWTDMEAMADYGLAVTAVNVGIMALVSAVNALIPRLSYLMGSERHAEELSDIVQRVTRMLLVIFAPLVIYFTSVSHFLFHSLFSAKYDSAVYLFQVMAISNLFIGFTLMTDRLLIAKGAIKPAVAWRLVAAVTSTVGCLVFVPIYGVAAAAVTFTASHLVAFLTLQSNHTIRRLVWTNWMHVSFRFVALFAVAVAILLSFSSSETLWPQTATIICFYVGMFILGEIRPEDFPWPKSETPANLNSRLTLRP